MIENNFTVYINGKKWKVKGKGKDNLEALSDAIKNIVNNKKKTILILKVEAIDEGCGAQAHSRV